MKELSPRVIARGLMALGVGVGFEVAKHTDFLFGNSLDRIDGLCDPTSYINLHQSCPGGANLVDSFSIGGMRENSVSEMAIEVGVVTTIAYLILTVLSQRSRRAYA